MDREQEFGFMLDCAKKGCMEYEINRQQLHALWIAFCIHHDLECDTQDYDSAVRKLWEALPEDSRVTFEWQNFVTFDLFMGGYLC